MPDAPALIDFNGLPAVRLTTGDGASAVVTLQGAQLVSWLPAGSGERLYLSERARFAPGQAIRGGVPVIFPQFGADGPLPRHGFARTRPWTLVEARRGDGYACATLRLEDDAGTRALWPHAFGAELTVMIEGKRLDVELEVTNPGGEAFAFTAALHNYFNLANVEMCRLQGLEGCVYRDREPGDRDLIDDNEALFVDDELDRTYFDVTKPLLLSEPARNLAIEAEGFPDMVVWNPWIEKCAALDDMPPTGFKRMLCVEPAAVKNPVQVAAGESWCGRQTVVAL